MSAKPHPISAPTLPVLTRADWDPAERWFRDTPRRCPEPFCGGRLLVEPATLGAEGRVLCLLCERAVATISLTSTLFTVRRAPKPKRWADAWDACIACGETTFKHSAGGRCMSCHAKHRRAQLAATAAPSGGEAGA